MRSAAAHFVLVLTAVAIPTSCAHAPPAMATSVNGEPAPAEPVLTAAPTATDGELAFGSELVLYGRSTWLRMSAPVSSLEGELDTGGFTVTFHGALSLDRAGPIAAASPSVERASILNRGDRAILTVRFVPGHQPIFRVEANGSVVTVTIGR